MQCIPPLQTHTANCLARPGSGYGQGPLDGARRVPRWRPRPCRGAPPLAPALQHTCVEHQHVLAARDCEGGLRTVQRRLLAARAQKRQLQPAAVGKKHLLQHAPGTGSGAGGQ
eukprot:364755-Chlamydomonas_euryale.AAC.4